jgi:hypothetical protein
MLRRNSRPNAQPIESERFTDLHDWVLSLPWVVERTGSAGAPEVRTFAVDCEPLGRRQLWLVTGLAMTNELAVIVPESAARLLEASGVGRTISVMPAVNALVALTDGAAGDPQLVEEVVLAGYCHAME